MSLDDKLLPAVWALVFVVAVALTWCLTGYLRLTSWLRQGDARKVNHVLALAGGSCWFGLLEPAAGRFAGLLAGCLLMALVILTCLLRRYRPFSWAFAGNTRASDAPHEALFFWLPWLVSMVGLLAIDLAAGDWRVTRLAALIVGVADGLAEPIGSRFGRHRFRVPLLWDRAPVTRSLEGCITVALGTLACILVVAPFSVVLLLVALLVAASVTVVEALTPHGFDNLTVALTAAGLLLACRPLLWPA